MPLSTRERRKAMQRELYTERVLAEFFQQESAMSDDDDTPIVTVLGNACDATMVGSAYDDIPLDDEDHEEEAHVTTLVDEPTTLFLCIVLILWYKIFTVLGVF